MHKAALLMSFGLIVNSSAALAAAPVLQLNARDGAQPRAIDAYSGRPQADAVASNPRGAFEPLSTAGAATLSDAVFSPSSAARPQLISTAAAYDGGMNAAPAALVGAARPAVIGATPKESLFYFLKNFRARPVQQPAHWTLFLVGICFVLYQMRRRPMRSSVGFNAAARLIGGDNERQLGPGMDMGGMRNAVSA